MSIKIKLSTFIEENKVTYGAFDTDYYYTITYYIHHSMEEKLYNSFRTRTMTIIKYSVPETLINQILSFANF